MSNEGTKDKAITEDDVVRVLGEDCGADQPENLAAAERRTAEPTPKPTEGEDAVPGAEAPEPETEEVDPRIAELEGEVSALKEQLLRELAEGENLRKRFSREREEQAKYALAPLAKDLLPVADNLRRALDSIPPEAIGEDERIKGLMAGVEMTEKALLEAFAKHHIALIDPKGEKLDPHRHEAMVEIPDGETPAGHISQVFEKGYMLRERLLRPARVAVSKGGPAKAPETKAETAAAAGPGKATANKIDTEPGATLDTKV